MVPPDREPPSYPPGARGTRNARGFEHYPHSGDASSRARGARPGARRWLRGRKRVDRRGGRRRVDRRNAGPWGAGCYAQVQAVFEKYGCTGCHPGVNPALDLQQGKLVRRPRRRASARRPESLPCRRRRSGRQLPLPEDGRRRAGGGHSGDRNPDAARARAVDPADLDLVRRWILQGAKDADGQTGGPEVPSPGRSADEPQRASATSQTVPGRSPARS